MPQPHQGRLPDFVVVGATKGGTTSLDFYLDQHPEIFMAKPKEPSFFLDGSPRSQWHRGLDWYRSQFVTSKRLCGEATPGYSHWPSRPLTVERMHEIIPHAKLIYSVREPMARLRSQYLMEYRWGLEQPTFVEYVRATDYARDSSRYGTQMRNFLRYFPPERILVIESAELLRDTAATMAKVYRFLGVDASFSTLLFRHRRNVTKGQMYPSDRGRRILHSPFLLAVRRRLPPGVFYHFRNALIFPFRVPPPSTGLPADLDRELRAELRREVQLLRELTGQPLPSLEVPAGPPSQA